MSSNVPRIVIAGAASNVGKTTVTAGVIAALRSHGLVVQPFKCGPDYIDPSYHERAAGRPCRNLDTWMLTDGQLLESFARACQGVDIAVVEGVMGLYDGSDWQEERGSTAQIAKLLEAPVVLVLDISGSARSVAAVVLGYKNFDPAVTFAGVVLNFAGSERHARGCAEAIEHATGLPMLGWLPRELRLRIPERHLGLVPGGEQVDSAALIADAAAAVSARFDIAAVADAGRRVESGAASLGAGTIGPRSKDAHASDAPAVVELRYAKARDRRSPPIIAVARDEAFCFYYPENLELLLEEGAEIEFFSPLRGERPSTAAAGVYLGGGYPELHGTTLASNTGLWERLKELHAADAPLYAECGGFMVLTQALVDSEGHHWAMAGLIPGVARMTGKLAALGYRQATALRPNLLAEQGESLRGHEFRYSSWVQGDADGVIRGAQSATAADTGGDLLAVPTSVTAAWHIRGARADAPEGIVGYATGNLLASYLHLHFGQRRELAKRFVSRLR